MNELLTIEDILGLATKPKKEETIKVKIKRLDKLIELRPLNFKELMTVITEQQSDELLIFDNCISPNLKDGKLNGISRIYYDSGQLKMETNYKDGEKDGMEKGYQENGKIIAELNYKKDCLHGTSKFYDKNGNLEHEQNYKEYVLHGTEKIYENGKVILEREYKDGEIVSSKNISE